MEINKQFAFREPLVAQLFVVRCCVLDLRFLGVGNRQANPQSVLAVLLPIFIIYFWLLSLPVSALFISSFPETQELIVADGETVYTVTFSATHPFGYSQIENMRVLFNYSQSNQNPVNGRGYMAWGKTDATITQYGGQWTLQDVPGGSRWGYMTNSWGGTEYMTPQSCSVYFSGSSSGGEGTVTVSWQFLAKPQWAGNPLVNSVDAWAEGGGNTTGWQQNPSETLVVASSCQNTPPDPRPPLLSNAGSNSIDIAIHPNDPDDSLYLITVAPSDDQRAYVQPDGTITLVPAWQTKQAWQGTRIQNLRSETTYSFRVRAVAPPANSCPSSFGAPASGLTLRQRVTVDLSLISGSMSKGTLGQATNVTSNPSSNLGTAQKWSMLRDSSVRGPAGGLDADMYNWKDMSGSWVGHTGVPGPNELTTLQWLRLARDYQSQPVITVNSRGVGPLNASGNCRFYYSDTSDETLIKLAADWVRYVNHILPNYRQGDILPVEDQAILDSLNWQGRPKLLSQGEAPTPRVDYWEIGNEPELGLPYCNNSGSPVVAHSPQEYARLYNVISQAMLGVDQNIKIGPCITHVAPGATHPWLDAVLVDHNLPVHFIAYHPYGPLYYSAMTHGDSPSSAERGLRDVRRFLKRDFDGATERVLASGRNKNNIEFLATEWNVSHWRWINSVQIRRQSHALGVAETLLTFAQQGIRHAHFWMFPSISDGTETPGFKMFQKAHELWGDWFIGSYDDGHNLRIYSTWNSATQEHVLWVLNFSESFDKTADILIPNIGTISSVTRHTLANVNGPTSLFDSNDPPYSKPPVIDWSTKDITSQFDSLNVTLNFPKATVTALVFKQPFLRDTPINTPVNASGFVVSAVYPSEGYMYVQPEARSFGVRVQGSVMGFVPGDRVAVSGVMSERMMQNLPVERQISSGKLKLLGSGEPPQPLFMAGNRVGGGPFAGTVGVLDGVGINNVGLLVTIVGEVTNILGSYINLDDGSGVRDLLGRRGVFVRLPSSAGIARGDIVKVTGVIEGSIPLNWTVSRRFIRARTNADIEVLAKAGSW